jgi:CheY-like chemotaxis protein
MQNQLFQGLKFQYIATLFHELCNPINSLLYMININQNEDENIKTEEKNNNKDSIVSSDEESSVSNSSSISDNNSSDHEKENEQLFIKRITRMNVVYKEKLKALEEKEKDINVLINMIYIFLENLMLYFKINLGVNLNDKNSEHVSINKEEIDSKNINNNNENDESQNKNKVYDLYKENDLNNANKNKKLNLAFSFNKILKKLSYLFKFKCIKYPKDFSYLSNKFIFIDESMFFDFLGQIYSLLYYIIPKSNGFELSYSIINGNKVKIIFKKYNFENKGMPLSRKRKHSVLFILCDDKFKATKSVKTLEMTKEILFKLSEILGIKLKIMEYESQTEDKYLTIIVPFFIEEHKLVLKTDSSKNLPKENKKLSAKNYLNPNFSLFNIGKKPTYLTENIEEKNSSEENNISSLNANKKNQVKEQNKVNNCKKNTKTSFILKPKTRQSKLSLKINLDKKANETFKIKTPVYDQRYSFPQIEKKKKSSTKYLNEIKPFCKKDNNFVKNDKNKNNENAKQKQNIKEKDKNEYSPINTLTFIHNKYSYLERLKNNGVEIFFENSSESLDKNINKFLYLDSIDSCDNKTCIKEKKSIDAEIDSDNFIEIDNEEEFKDKNKEIKKNKKSSNNLILNINNIFKNSHNNRIHFSNDLSKLNIIENRLSIDSLLSKAKNANNIEHTNIITFKKCNCKDILIVDDDEFICKTFKKILQKFKLEADCAQNGQECLDMIKNKQKKNCKCPKGKYKIILMDITMPIMDGIEAAKNIQKMIDEHELYDTIKIIFISAHVNLDLSNILSGIKCAIDYYPKPISANKYKTLLDKYYYS